MNNKMLFFFWWEKPHLAGVEGRAKTFLPKAASNVADRRFCWEPEDVDLDSDRQKTKLT